MIASGAVELSSHGTVGAHPQAYGLVCRHLMIAGVRGLKILCNGAIKPCSDDTVELSSGGTVGAQAPRVRSIASIFYYSKLGELKSLLFRIQI